MKLSDFRLLTDENLDPEVVAYLRTKGFDLADVCERRLQGRTDLELLQLATSENRVVVTHDADFGTLAVLQGEPLIGIVYLRPGHVSPQPTIAAIEAILNQISNLAAPFILVAKSSPARIAIRVRHLGP